MTALAWLYLLLIMEALTIIALVWVVIGLHRHVRGLRSHRATIIELLRRGEESRTNMLKETHLAAVELLAATTSIATEIREEAQKRHEKLHARLDEIEQKRASETAQLDDIQTTGDDTNRKVSVVKDVVADTKAKP
jgi:hypothetical protein